MRFRKSCFFSKIIGGIVLGIALGLSSVIFSCADSTPAFSKASFSVVLDYKDEESKPEARFALFLLMNSDNRRAESFTVKSSDDTMNMEWIVSNPKIVTIENQKYVFVENLATVGSEPFKKGLYNVVYTDAAGQEIEFDFNVGYDDGILEAKSSEVRGMLGSATENIVLYNEFNMIIYIGKRKSNWSSDEGILKDYKAAAFKRTVFFTKDNKVVCLLPMSNIAR